MVFVLVIVVEKKIKDFGSKFDNKSEGGLVFFSVGIDG